MWLALSCALAACSAYDPELIKVESRDDGQSAAGRGGKGGSTGSDGGPEAGRSGDSGADGGGGASGAIGPRIPVDVVHCGDGRVTGSETCDISISSGTSGACATECPELAKCAPRALNNPGGCQASCVLLELVCKSGDDCCPGKCNADNDSDCSSSCGDGIVQSSNGETCEPESDTPCKTSAADCDDEDACTVDALMGSASNCNTVCSHTAVTGPKGGDSCCPEGANANTDTDCTPRCGNGVREGTEECDGGNGCDASCKPIRTPAQLSCLEKFGSDECGRCSCINCTETYTACRGGMNEALNKQCNDVLACAAKEDCFSTACYCGPSCVVPSGPCKMEIEVAANSTDALTVNARRADTNFAIGRALLADTCRVQNCATACRPPRPTNTPMAR